LSNICHALAREEASRDKRHGQGCKFESVEVEIVQPSLNLFMPSGSAVRLAKSGGLRFGSHWPLAFQACKDHLELSGGLTSRGWSWFRQPGSDADGDGDPANGAGMTKRWRN
jgi:hypothetical protein